MNDEQLNKLFRDARAAKPATSRAEYGFETRLIARLRSTPEVPWFAFAWRLVPVFALIVLALSLWVMSGSEDLRTAIAGAHVETFWTGDSL